MDTAVDSFLTLSAARLAPRTVDAYRRDLAAFSGWLGGSPASASPEQLAAYFEERKIAFRAPEYRKIQLITVSQQEIASTIEVSEEGVPPAAARHRSGPLVGR